MRKRSFIFFFLLAAMLLLVVIISPKDESGELSSPSLAGNQCIQFYKKKIKSVDELFIEVVDPVKPSHLVNADFFAGMEKSGFNWLLHRDNTGKFWTTAFSSLSPGVSEFILRSPTELLFQEQLLTLMDYFQTFGFSHLTDNKMGLVMQIESGSTMITNRINRNFHFYRLSDLERLKKTGELAKAQTTAFNDYLDFVFDGYLSRRMKLSDENRQKLKDISMKFRSRSHLLFLSESGMMDYRPEFGIAHIKNDADKFRESGIDPESIPTRVLPEKFNFIGGAVVVTSRSEKELLPLEAFTGFKVPRKKGVTAEIGRFFVSRVHRDPKTSYNLVGLVASLTKASRDKGIGKIDQIVIEADRARAEIFAEYGFSPIHEQINFEGKKEFVMVATPDTVVENARRILRDGLESEKSSEVTTLYRPHRIRLEIARQFHFDSKNYRGPIHTFGNSSYGFAASNFYDLAQSKIAWEKKVQLAGKYIKESELKILPAYIADPDQVTTRLIEGITQDGIDGFLKVLKDIHKTLISEAEFKKIYVGEGLRLLTNQLDKQMALYPNQAERMNVMYKTLTDNFNFWHNLNGDHGKYYALLDYYLNGGPDYLPSDSIRAAVERNRGSDLNLFEAETPNVSGELASFIKSVYYTKKSQRNMGQIQRDLIRLTSRDPKLADLPFHIIWESLLNTLKEEGIDSYSINSHIRYDFWMPIVFSSGYIKDVKFIKRPDVDYYKISE